MTGRNTADNLQRTRCPRHIDILRLISALAGYVLQLAGLLLGDPGKSVVLGQLCHAQARPVAAADWHRISDAAPLKN